MSKNPEKLKKLPNSFNEIFRKYVSYDNIKVTKKQGLTLLENTYLGKPQEGVRMINNKSSHQRCSVKTDVLRNFAKFTGKHLRQSLSF